MFGLVICWVENTFMISDNSKRIILILAFILAILIPYIIGQAIDNDNLFFGLELKPFWQYQIRNCPAC